MSIARIDARALLGPRHVAPSSEELRVVGVFNPGAVAIGGSVVLLVRVAEAAREARRGYAALPRWDCERGTTVIDWMRKEELIVEDPRVVTVRSTGMKRLTFISHLLVVYIRDGLEVQRIGPGRFMPQGQMEEFGVEDPRIIAIDGRFYITYVAVSRHGAATALASSEDFLHFTRHGVIFPPENKDVVLFPERIGDEYLALHRPNPAQHFSAPEIWLASSPDLLHWGRHRPFLRGDGPGESGRIGAGTPPLRTTAGWLEIYHGNGPTLGIGSAVGTYTAGALLMDLNDPRKVIGRCPQVLVPEADYERRGFVPKVVFPTGIVCQEDRLLVYYGAADESTAVVEFRLRDLLAAMRR